MKPVKVKINALSPKTAQKYYVSLTILFDKLWPAAYGDKDTDQIICIPQHLALALVPIIQKYRKHLSE